MRVKCLNCRKQPDALKSLLNMSDPSRWDVLCIQEPPITIDSLPSFRSTRWNLVLPTPAPTRSPDDRIRSVIYVSNDLPSDLYSQIVVNSLDLTAIKFTFSDFSLSIFSIYNPPNTDLSIPPTRAALRDPMLLDTPSLLLGDFNMHHPLWAGPTVPQRTDRSDADALLQLLADFDLTLALPPGTPTCLSDAHQTWSTIDLVFASGNIADLIVECTTDHGHGSDHQAINTTLNLDVPRNQVEP